MELAKGSSSSSSSMVWRRREKRAESAAAAYERLSGSSVEEESDGSSCNCKVRRGHVPVLVGESGGAAQRFLVPVKLFRSPSMAELLDMGEQEFGSRQQGVLRIPCDVAHFRRVMDFISACTR